ncbi:MAG TPA: hypothetical protein VET24_13935 [Actinomycetota bacterium]|nr:hypothetical protein [Actinomycetota bacterium]
MSVRHDEGVASAGYGGSGANEFTFSGAGTTITFFPATPGPVVAGHEGGELHYQGPEGDLTFFGSQITRLDSALGTLLTVTLRAPHPDVGGTTSTLVLPQVTGVTRQNPVNFETVGIKTT